MHKISMEGMVFFAHHGYYHEERERGNKFIVDLHIEADLSVAAKSDDLNQTINYEDSYRIIKEQMAIRSHLLENAAQRIIKALKEHHSGISSVEVRVSKINPPVKGMVESVSVTIKG